MRVLFYASHLLHYRSLIPVMVELSRRGHTIGVQTTRPDWLGMPSWQMNWRPTKVTGINRTSLAWLAGKMGYGEEWQQAAGSEQFGIGLREADRYVTTTKDIDWLKLSLHDHGSLEPGFAVGYQHLPVVIALTHEAERWQFPQELPEPFRVAHEFEALHGFRFLYSGNTVYPCGFPHLDKMARQGMAQAFWTPSARPYILVQGPGNGRGVEGSQWLIDVQAICWSMGYGIVLSSHWLHGIGDQPYPSDQRELADAIRHAWPGGDPLQVVGHWWPWAAGAACILTCGSSMIYEMWSLGMPMTYVLGFAGGERWKKFEMFPDLILRTPKDLEELLSFKIPTEARRTLTAEVMAGFRSVHTGQGAKTAADVIEGKR